MIVESMMLFGAVRVLKEIFEDEDQDLEKQKNIQQTPSKQLTPYEEIMGVVKKIIKMPNNKIEEMISILENNSSNLKKLPEKYSYLNEESYRKKGKNKYSLTYAVEGYLEWDERKVLRKIGNNNDLKELLKFILDMKINKECFKELSECNGELNQKEQKFIQLKEKFENEQKEDINQLIKQIEEKNKRLIYLEDKQNNLDEFIQEQINQKLKIYEEKVKNLEKENKELKEQLGLYE